MRNKIDGYLSKHLDLGKTFFNIFVSTGQICTGFEADTPIKVIVTCPSYETFR